MEEKQDNAPDNDSNELESTDASQGSNAPATPAGADGNEQAKASAGAPKSRGGIKNLLSHVNIYFLGFLLLLVVAGSGGGIYYVNTKKEAESSGAKSQALSTESLKQLANSDVTVGDSKQVLTVQSNAIFDGSVLLRGDVDIAGKLVVGDQLSLSGVNVGGQSNFEDMSVSNDLSVGGNTAVQGLLTVQNGLSVNGTTKFNGGLSVDQLTVSTLNLNNTLTLTRHVVAGGGTPARSSGSALGSGGTTSVSGSDTAGSIKINTGSSPGAGCFVTVTFNQTYNNTPHVVVSPVGSAAGGLDYYVNRTTSSFSVCTSTPAGSSKSFGFDYIVFG